MKIKKEKGGRSSIILALRRYFTTAKGFLCESTETNIPGFPDVLISKGPMSARIELKVNKTGKPILELLRPSQYAYMKKCERLKIPHCIICWRGDSFEARFVRFGSLWEIADANIYNCILFILMQSDNDRDFTLHIRGKK
jgi:hypothetical protein